MHQFSIIPASVTASQAAGWFTNRYVSAIYSNGNLVWPAP
jgi:NitT/TauT family transport system substrate-binding protein